LRHLPIGFFGSPKEGVLRWGEFFREIIPRRGPLKNRPLGGNIRATPPKRGCSPERV